MFTTKLILWNLTQNQHTPAGDVLRHIYYNIDLTTVLEGRSGYPHNGGQHTLYAKTTIAELKSWLDLVLSELGEAAQPFVDAINVKIKDYVEKYYDNCN